ncbi:MAG: thiamine phosphate synthase [Acidobacteria bacterium]|nr:thiamine phosphate synthase [Acidobacteriota bacterium]
MTLPILYPILDTALLDSHGCTALAAAEAMLEAGVQILQWRCKDPITRARFEEAEAIRKLCQRHGAQFVVNDRTDIAILAGAGLHIGQEDMPVALAREMVGEHTLLGVSTHNRAQFEKAVEGPVDYVAFGPVFQTMSKANPDPVTGLARLREMRGLTALPLTAIGGINRGNVHQVLDAGADSVAVISDLIPGICTRDTVRQRIYEWFEILHGQAGVRQEIFEDPV